MTLVDVINLGGGTIISTDQQLHRKVSIGATDALLDKAKAFIEIRQYRGRICRDYENCTAGIADHAVGGVAVVLWAKLSQIAAPVLPGGDRHLAIRRSSRLDGN